MTQPLGDDIPVNSCPSCRVPYWEMGRKLVCPACGSEVAKELVQGTPQIGDIVKVSVQGQCLDISDGHIVLKLETGAVLSISGHDSVQIVERPT